MQHNTGILHGAVWVWPQQDQPIIPALPVIDQQLLLQNWVGTDSKLLDHVIHVCMDRCRTSLCLDHHVHYTAT